MRQYLNQGQLRKRVLEMRRKYGHPTTSKSIWQLVNTVPPHLALGYVIYLNWSGPVWITAILLFVNSLLLNRIFVLFHDVMHVSFFKSRRVADVVGTVLGILIFHPAHHWQYEHNFHHATSNDLSKKGIGNFSIIAGKPHSFPIYREQYNFATRRTLH